MGGPARLGPAPGPGGRRRWCGEDRLVEIGGDGTPLVQELCIPELAVARRVHTLSLRAAMADALDLRHRLPRTWEVLGSGECEPWLARRVASLSRRLDQFQVRIVDDAVAEAIAGESPARVLELTQAKVIEADPRAHAERLAVELRKRYVGCSRIDEHGLRTVIARVEAGPAEFVDDLVDRVALALDQRRDLVAHLPAEVGRDGAARGGLRVARSPRQGDRAARRDHARDDAAPAPGRRPPPPS